MSTIFKQSLLKLARFEAILSTADLEVLPDPADELIITFRDAGFGTDAPILAAAASANVDRFCTGDRGILERAALAASLGVNVVSPRDLLDQISS